MLHVNKRLPQGRGLAPALLRRTATVELDWDTRGGSRFGATDSAGRQLGAFLPRGQVLRGSDVLVAEDGSLVRGDRGAAKSDGLHKRLAAVRACRSVRQVDMVHNDYLPVMQIGAQTYEVRAGGQLLTCEPPTVLPMTQRYFLF